MRSLELLARLTVDVIVSVSSESYNREANIEPFIYYTHTVRIFVHTSCVRNELIKFAIKNVSERETRYVQVYNTQLLGEEVSIELTAE